MSISFGCVAMQRGDNWVVLSPNNKVLATFTDEYDARNEAMFRNLTATDEELEDWGREHS